MTGPPTPPPSSAVEIEDAARSMLPPQAAPAPATEPSMSTASQPLLDETQPPIVSQTKQSTIYELLFPSISDLARSGSLRELTEVAERGDLSGDFDADPTRLLLVGPLVLAYLILDELPLARHVLTRLPEGLASFPLSQGLFQLVASASERKYSDIYRRADELHHFVLQPTFGNPEFSQILAGMITSFVGGFRKKTFDLLARAYTSIPLPLAQWYLGYPADQAEEFLKVAFASHWAYDSQSHILTPTTRPTSYERNTVYTQSTLSALHLVADSVATLEA
ncbi:hypothetical protein BD414DRAFT_485075 [Trametes punicea]|nr:hypothetical protein BD414DRAFT_485075 [Trametes punicea]